MKKKKNSMTSIELYEKNLCSLMNISRFIDEDDIYPPETQSNSIFIKLLFQDIRKSSKLYTHDEWRPIKAAIHNCYKLLQKGYVPENQIELQNNIKILEILLKDSSIKKSNIDKITEEVMQNIFDKTLKNLNEANKNKNNIENNTNNNININNNTNNNIEINNNLNSINIIDDNNNINNKNKNDFVTKEEMNKVINEQKQYYETKINSMKEEINDLKNKVNELNNLMNNIGKCFINFTDMKNSNNKKE